MSTVTAIGTRHRHAVELTGWEPRSPCRIECLPESDSIPGVGRLRMLARLVGLGSSILAFALLAVVAPSGVLLTRSVFRAVLRLIGVRLVCQGGDRFDEGTGGVLVVANHLSWLDILVLGAVQPMRMIAKREVRDLPMLGAVAARVGTLFIDRSGLRSLPSVVSAAADALRAGSVLCLFPEGTTWCGAAIGRFRRAGFQAALDAGVPVRPVAQRMRLPDGTATSVGAFIGEDTLGDSVLRVLRLPGLTIEVDILPLLIPEAGTDRRELASRAQWAISQATGAAAPKQPVPRPASLPAAA